MLINGQPANQLAANNRGLSYGDGVFRTLKIHNHQPVAWAAQYHKLASDCQKLSLMPPSPEDLLADLRQLFAQQSTGVAKIIIIRGQGSRGYAPDLAAKPIRICSAHPLPKPPESLALGISPIRLGHQPALAGIKHLNRLEQVLARQDCQQQGVADCLMLDQAGRVISTTMRNIIVKLHNRWVTPRLDLCGVAGATRARLMQAADITEQHITLEQCRQAQGMVACNSLAEAVPVTHIQQQFLPASDVMAAECQNLLGPN